MTEQSVVSPDYGTEQSTESTRWKEKLTNVQFSHRLLQGFPALMAEFLDGEGQEIETELKHAVELTEQLYGHDPEQLQDLYKYLTLGCVFTQNRFKKKKDNSEVRESPRRKFETKTIKRYNNETGIEEDIVINPPSFIHPLRAYIKSLELRAHSSVSKAAPIHDIYEDGRMIIDDEEVAGEKILAIIREEFATDAGADVSLLVEAVSKYEQIPNDIEGEIKNHFFYRAIVNNVLLHLHRNNIDALEIAKYEESILKAISSVVKLQLTLLENTQDEEDYLHKLARAFLLKSIDINDNLASPGTRPPILLRDRMFATIQRLMHSPLADEMMTNMALQEDDPLFAGRNLADIVTSLTVEEKKRLEQEAMQSMYDIYGIRVEPSKLHAGLRIPFRDEGDTTPAPQIIIRCKKSEIEQMRGHLHTMNGIASLSRLTNKSQEELATFVPYNGVLENIVNILGRDGIMIKVQHEGNTKLYIRVIEDKPTYMEYAQRSHPRNRKAPEAKLFSRLFVNPDDRMSMVRSLLNSRAGLTFDPESLMLDPDTVIFTSPHGVMSCRKSDFSSHEAMVERACERLKVNKKRCKPYHILTHAEGNLDNPYELHVYMLDRYST